MFYGVPSDDRDRNEEEKEERPARGQDGADRRAGSVRDPDRTPHLGIPAPGTDRADRPPERPAPGAGDPAATHPGGGAADAAGGRTTARDQEPRTPPAGRPPGQPTSSLLPPGSLAALPDDAAPTLPIVTAGRLAPDTVVGGRFQVRHLADAGDALEQYSAMDQEPWRGCWGCGASSPTPERYCRGCGRGLAPALVDLWVLARPAAAERLLRAPEVLALLPPVQGPFRSQGTTAYAVRQPPPGLLEPPLPERLVTDWLRRAALAADLFARAGAPWPPVGIGALTDVRGSIRLASPELLLAPPRAEAIEPTQALAALAYQLLGGEQAVDAGSRQLRQRLREGTTGLLSLADLAAGFAPAPASYTYGLVSHRIHAVNEDCAIASTAALIQHHDAEPAGLFAVSDGMTSGGQGANASRVVGRSLLRAFHRLLADGEPGAGTGGCNGLRQAMLGGVAEARAALGTSFPGEKFRAGATMVCLAVVGKDALLAHLGDSRAYRIRGGALERLTNDHSPVFDLVRQGQLTVEGAAEHPSRSAISRYVGNVPAGDPEVQAFPIAPGDRFVLCSDGLWSRLDERQIAALATEGDCQAAATRLVEAAVAAGLDDDATAVVVQAEAPPRDLVLDGSTGPTARQHQKELTR